MAQQFYIDAKVKLDTSSIQSQLKGVKIPDLGTSNASKGVKTLGQDFLDTTKKVAKFGAITSIIGTFTSAVGLAVTQVKEFDDAVTNFKKVSDLTGSSLDAYTQKLGKLGETVNRSRTEMVQSATQFKQAGFTDEDSAKLSQVAELYRNVADTQLTSAESASFLVSQMKAFNITADDSIGIINQINQVSNDYSVSSSDISSALSKSSASLSAYGNSLSETIALTTAGSEVMVNQAGRVSRGIVSIGANIVKLANSAGELTYQVDGMTKNISLFDSTTGEMKNTYEVLKEISTGWDKMSTAEKSSLALNLAGKTQISTFTSILGNFNTAITANEDALNSQGSASKENAKYMESLSAKFNALKASIQNIILGDGGLEKFLGKILEVSNSFVKFADNTNLLGVAFTGLATILTISALPSLASFGTQAIAMATVTIPKLITALSLADAGLMTVSGTMAAFTPLIALAVVAVSAGVMAFNAMSKSSEELEQDLSDLITATQSLQSEYDSLSSKNELTENEKVRLNLLNAEIEANKQLIQQEYEKTAAARQQTETAGATATGVNAGYHNRSKVNTSTVSGALNADAETSSIGQAVTAYNTLMDAKAKSLEQDDKITTQKAALLSKLSQEGIYLQDLKDKGVTLTQSDQALLDSITKITGSYEKNSSAVSTQSDELKDLQTTYGLTDDQISSVKDTMDSLGVSAEEAYNQLYGTTTSADDLSKALSTAMENVSGMSDAYESLYGAVNEYNTTGSLSLDTLKNLSSLSDDYLSTLDIENGKLSVNEEGLKSIANSRIDEAEAAAYESAMADLNALSMDNTATATNNASSASSGFITASQDTTNALAQLIPTLDSASGAYDKVWSSMTQNVKVSTENKKAETQIGDALKTKLSLLEKARGSIGTYISASKTSTSATKSGTSATNAQNDAIQKQIDLLNEQKQSLQDQQDAVQENISTYKSALSYLISEITDDIDKLQTKEETALNKIVTSAQKIVGTYSDNNEIDDMVDEITKTYTSTIEDAQSQIKDLTSTYQSDMEDIDSELYDLRKQKIEETYQAQIDALDEANSALEDQLKLEEALEALAEAKSKKTMVFKDGSFQYTEDESAVSSAQSAYDELLSQQEYADSVSKLQDEESQALADLAAQYKSVTITSTQSLDEQIATLEQSRIDKQNSYNQQVSDLTSYIDSTTSEYEREKAALEALSVKYNKTKDTYDSQITSLEAFKTKLENLSSSLENADAKIAVSQIFNIDANKLSSNWATVISKLGDFKDSYNADVEKLKEIKIQISGVDTAIAQLQKIQSQAQATAQAIASTGTTPTSTTTSTKTGTTSSNKTRMTGQQMYASGVSSVGDNQIALVGDSPNSELVIGSKLNGTPTSLSKGSGVVNAESTKTLAGIFNSIGSVNGKTSAMSIGSGGGNNQNITIGNISLPNVSDAKSFMSELQGFSSGMLQYSYSNG